jgi:hypothetical protein
VVEETVRVLSAVEYSDCVLRICRQARRAAVVYGRQTGSPACDGAEPDLPRHGRTDLAVPLFDHEWVQHRALAGN